MYVYKEKAIGNELAEDIFYEYLYVFFKKCLIMIWLPEL